MKAVFDTNIFISAFIVPGSQGEKAFLLARQKRFELFTSVPILTETANKLREKFDQSDEDIKEALKMISRAAEVLKPSLKLDVLEDIPDNRILECGVEAKADVIVTGDRHLLKLKKFQGIPIVRLADFLRMFPGEPQ
ncbi:MAG: putative toxin-antitoxin system toxin component, PIN family [Deltaproteobacteria bacterium]|nr:putative toxin-antitoxin system toxin component, PIN family [Deltaproteobacteria bacterium]